MVNSVRTGGSKGMRRLNVRPTIALIADDKNPQKLCQSTVEMFTTWKFAMLVRPQLLLHLVLVFSLELFL